jgi:hypothetical protein
VRLWYRFPLLLSSEFNLTFSLSASGIRREALLSAVAPLQTEVELIVAQAFSLLDS